MINVKTYQVQKGQLFVNFAQNLTSQMTQPNEKGAYGMLFKCTHLVACRFNPFIQLLSLGPVHDCWVVFSFYSNFNMTVCKQTVETLIRRHISWCLFLVGSALFTYVPQKKTLDFYGLIWIFIVVPTLCVRTGILLCRDGTGVQARMSLHYL